MHRASKIKLSVTLSDTRESTSHVVVEDNVNTSSKTKESPIHGLTAPLSSSSSSHCRGLCQFKSCAKKVLNCFQCFGSRVKSTRFRWGSGYKEASGLREIKPLEEESANAYPHNRVKNTHYTIHNFLFMNLYEQFRRPLNFYFLIVTVLQFVPAIAPVSPFSTLIPILFAFTLTAIKEGCDDVERYRHDCAYNGRVRLVLDKTTAQWCYRLNASIRVGDVIMLQQNEDIPCDMVAVAASAPTIFIRTDNLDGEIDLKPRNIVAPPIKTRLSPSSREGTHRKENLPNQLHDGTPSAEKTFISMNDSATRILQKLDCMRLTLPSPNPIIDSFDGVAIFDMQKLRCSTSDLNDIAALEVEKLKSAAMVSSMCDPVLGDFVTVSLSHNHLLPQFCLLKNTSKLIGVAVYTGNETKCGMNKHQTPVKWAKIDQDVNRYAMYIFIFQICVSVVFGIIAMRKNEQLDERVWYLPHENDYAPAVFVVYVMRFFLLTSVMIPLSFKLVVDVSKYYMAKKVVWDKAMIHSNAGRNRNCVVGCSVKNSSILEDLGQIDHVLTDKTGTLTENIMTLSKITVAPKHRISLKQLELPDCVCWSSPRQKTGVRLASQGEKIEFVDTPTPTASIGSPDVVNFEVTDFASVMALCTSAEVIPVKRLVSEATPELSNRSSSDRDNFLQFTYQASSPDEVALCCGAAKLGVILEFRTPHQAVLRISEEKHRYTIHHVFPFSSDTKTMGIIFEHTVSRRILLVVKGADDQVASMLARPLPETHPEIVEDLRMYAKSGLRVLLFAQREMTRQELNDFLAQQEAAELDLLERDTRTSEIRTQTMCTLTPLGISAIEDELQENVEETISMMVKAGIKVWMLTGDKMETSEKIALSCGLYNPKHRIIRIAQNATPGVDWVKYFMSDDLMPQDSTRCPNTSRARTGTPQFDVLVLEGGYILDEILSNAVLMERFEKLSTSCLSVICVRTTPGQKAAVCHFLRKRGHMTLAVGDGGNDVAMLQEANVGVGILGRESAQAARAADFSIAQFDDLRSLIFYHGQQAYICTAYLIKYSFYKSMLIAFTQIAYSALFTYYSGQSFWTSFMLLMWNGVYTLPPTLFYCLDRCVPRVVFERFPSLYKLTRKGTDLNFKELFLCYVFRGILQSVLLLWLLTKIFDETFLFRQNGETASAEVTFTTAYTSIFFCQLIMIFTESHSVTGLNFFVIFFLPFFYVGVTFVYSQCAPSFYYGVFRRTWRFQYIVVVMVITLILALPWVLLMCLRDFLWVNHRKILRDEELRRCKQLLEQENAYENKFEVFLRRYLGFYPEPASSYLVDKADSSIEKLKTEDAISPSNFTMRGREKKPRWIKISSQDVT